MNTPSDEALDTAAPDMELSLCRGDDPTPARTERRVPFDDVLRTAWSRAERRGFAPGRELEFRLEAELGPLLHPRPPRRG